jgi:ATP-binding cassette, subfamily D (ALD), member 3
VSWRQVEETRRAAHVDAEFWVKVWRLIRIAVPSPICRETFYLSILALVLIIRTYLSIRITGINGEIVKSIVQRDFPAFLSRLGILASIAIPASIVNSLLKFLRGRIALSFRSRLTAHFHDRYLHGNMFYSVLQLDSRITHPDQALTETIDKWSVSCSQLYSDITKPLLDIVLFAWKISDVIGPLGPLAVIVYYMFCGVVIQTISPRFGRMTAQTQKLEGSFRTAHHRLITSSEEVAFYGGQEREKSIINGKFRAVVVNQAEFFRKQLSMGVLDGFLTKYGAVLLGYSVLGLPVFGPGREAYNATVASDPAQITRDYVRNSGLLM